MKDKRMEIYELAHDLYANQEKIDMSNPFSVAKIVIENGYQKIPPHYVVMSKSSLTQEIRESARNEKEQVISELYQYVLKHFEIDDKQKRTLQYYLAERFMFCIKE